jgi:hypothetical protein
MAILLRKDGSAFLTAKISLSLMAFCFVFWCRLPQIEGRWRMRILLKCNMQTEAANAVARAGKLGSVIQSILEDLKPEAAYFTADNGQRTAFLFLEIKDSSEIPKIAEPWFLAFGADVEIKAVMVPQDLAKAGADIDRAVRKYGSVVPG